jgi:hypothetical protein
VTIAEQQHSAGPSPQEKAESVRAYLVAIRGGAPFLSAADGRLLVKWIEQGISVARILAAVDEVAEKRRKKMTRGRLTLTACRRSIEGGKKKNPAHESTNQPPANSVTVDFSDYINALNSGEVPPELSGAQSTLIKRLDALSKTANPEQAATEAVAACRTFQETAWKMAQAEHQDLRAQALEELAALRNVLSAEALEAAIEEVARDIVRRRFPLVSAREVWDRVSTK